MTPDEARELFSDAVDDCLSPHDKQRFDALLAQDAGLTAEYQDFRHMLDAVAMRARVLSHAEVPNLLPGIQRRLHQRYRGRYFRDRFAQKVGSGALNPWLLGGAMLGTVLLAWLALWWLGVAQR